VRFLAKAEYFEGTGVRGWWSRSFFRFVDAVPVRRDDQRGAMAALEAGLGVLRDEVAFGIYPEGTRSRDGRLYRGRPGVGWLALRSEAVIVPVSLSGTDRMQPVGSRLPRICRVRMEIGEVIDPTPWRSAVAAGSSAGVARREITDLVMDRIAAGSGQVRAAGYNEFSAEAE
jgi:1-acyl-sn-glycerol-3-phosphate acyltransferase